MLNKLGEVLVSKSVPLYSSPEVISARIRATREARGFSASQFSRAVGVTPAAVWYWEKKAISPTNPALGRIAKVLGVSTRYLLSTKGEFAEIDYASQPIVTSILNDAKARIGKATGRKLTSVKLNVVFAPEHDG
jgi:transcriptional regulator with XRE-family HTH domain